MARRRGPRSLDEADRRLWAEVVRSIVPLSPRSAQAPREAPASDFMPETFEPRKSPAAIQPPVRTAPAAPPRKPPAPPAPPAPHDPGTIDGALQRKLRRGRIEPDAVIDLHGLGQAAAHQRLRSEVPRLRAAGGRCLLVVTGKGSASALARHTLHGDTISSTPERRGILRESLPRWLAEAEFHAHVAAIRPAHPRHGGGGAFYVWLRRPRPGR